MDTRRRGARWAFGAIATVAVLACGVLLFPEGAVRPVPAALGELRIAPDPLPPGGTEVIVGSASPLPGDLRIEAVDASVLIEKVEVLSRNAVRLVVAPQAVDVGLRLTAGAESREARLRVEAARGPLALAANLPPAEEIPEPIVTPRDVFPYAFLPAEGAELASLCILNEQNGAWCQRDLAPPPMEAEAEEAVREDFLGVPLEPGPNRLLIATFSRTGRSVLEELTVVREEPKLEDEP